MLLNDLKIKFLFGGDKFNNIGGFVAEPCSAYYLLPSDAKHYDQESQQKIRSAIKASLLENLYWGTEGNVLDESIYREFKAFPFRKYDDHFISVLNKYGINVISISDDGYIECKHQVYYDGHKKINSLFNIIPNTGTQIEVNSTWFYYDKDGWEKSSLDKKSKECYFVHYRIDNLSGLESFDCEKDALNFIRVGILNNGDDSNDEYTLIKGSRLYYSVEKTVNIKVIDDA